MKKILLLLLIIFQLKTFGQLELCICELTKVHVNFLTEYYDKDDCIFLKDYNRSDEKWDFYKINGKDTLKGDVEDWEINKCDTIIFPKFKDSIISIFRNYLIKSFGKINANKIINHKYWIGMTYDMARESLGFPDEINRSTTPSIVYKQVIYERRKLYLYFENDVLKSYQD